MGDAVTCTLLLSDWERYGLSERVSYHFDLTEALVASSLPSSSSQQQVEPSIITSETDNKATATITAAAAATTTTTAAVIDEPQQTSGVVGMLECIPFAPFNKLNKRQKRALRNDSRDFNLECLRIRNSKQGTCHEPQRLPLRLNPASRLFFAYEVNRMAFCLDASPTLTSTFGSDFDAAASGIGIGGDAICPMDRVGAMAKLFFEALSEPIDAPPLSHQKVWRPELNVSVIAVYPRGTGSPPTSLLVRDFRVYDKESATLLAQKIEEWCLTKVESEIARRLSRRQHFTTSGDEDENQPLGSYQYQQNHIAPNNLLAGYDAWNIHLHTSSLQDILDAADVTLSILSSAAKPCIVVATDGRSVSCDGVMDILADADRSDVPLIVLDLSSPTSHSKHRDPNSESTRGTSSFNEMMNLGGPSTFPLHLSDDTEALHGICRATGGCFFDKELLLQAAKAKAGQLEDSPFHVDHYFSFRRRSVKPNAVQWYVLFSLSPLSPTFNSAWGKIIPPRYLRGTPQQYVKQQEPVTGFASSNIPIDMSRDRRYMTGWGSRMAMANIAAHSSSDLKPSPTSDLRRLEAMAQRKQVSRITFSTYVVNPIRIKGLLMMRVKEGYHARQYGQSTQDTDRVLIQFNLQLELGTILHYELSYKALPNQSHMVGVAHIKIELSGEPSFISSVKHDFLRQTHVVRPETMAQQVSARLCKILRWIRREDCLQSYLCPLVWSDQLASPDTPFIRRLRTLTTMQRRKHFRFDQFDIVCTGRMPYALDDGFLSEFLDTDNGEQEFFDAITEWSTQTIVEGCRYVRQTDCPGGNLANYCIVELAKSAVASRVFTVSLEFFGGTGASDRLRILESLKEKLSMLKDVVVLSKQMADYVVAVRNSKLDDYTSWKRHLLLNQHHHASWDLVKDPELLPLIMKRRREIGDFYLLESCDNHALFAKLVHSSKDNTEDLVQYQIAILRNRVVIDLHMECTSGDFFPFRSDAENRFNMASTHFHKLAQKLKRRDQECGRALRCRTALLKLFEDEDKRVDEAKDDETELACVTRLLPYANKVVRKLRYFNPGSGKANEMLMLLSEEILLSNFRGVPVARLPIGPREIIGDVENGAWFIAVFDRHTIAIIHYSLVDQQEATDVMVVADDDEGDETEVADSVDLGNNAADVEDAAGATGKYQTYRNVTLFTVCISDLYSLKNDDVASDDDADDDSVDTHISEFIQTTEFAENLEEVHTRMFATAPYMALKEDSTSVESFDPDDLNMALNACEFVEVASVMVGSEPVDEVDSAAGDVHDSKLMELLFTVMGQVNGYKNNAEEALFFYKLTEQEEEEVYTFGDEDTDSLSEFGGSDVDIADIMEDESESGELSTALESAIRSDDVEDGVDHNDTALLSSAKSRLWPPVFVRFTLDGKNASIADLSSVEKASNLAMHLSVFRGDIKIAKSRHATHSGQLLPDVHSRVALKVTSLLNAYVAEQTLERLRHFGRSLTEDDLRVVKSCLRGARNVLTSKTEVYFYSAKVDTMVLASAPAGGEEATSQGFTLLREELEKNGRFVLQKFRGNVFIAMEGTSNLTALDFWCFINIKNTISVKVYHPEGPDMAFEVMKRAQETISRMCHRVNQELLLKRLHQSRTASELLIPKDAMVTSELETAELGGLFSSGIFSCPVVFRTSFELFHRCATNPAQVARKLEASVLHSFAVSNRRNCFVYKDETGDVFYMMLESHRGGVEADGTIDLVVFGIQEPGPSITTQLSQLLQRRLLHIAVDMLSSVLTKNPHFHWKQADLDFIHSFEEAWRALDGTEDSKPNEQVVHYEFPNTATNLDPGMILLYFRQNLCGSTFFHRLNEFVGDMQDDNNEVPSTDVEIPFIAHDFTFYYNNSPSKLDPQFQSVSTLTEKGAEFCREAGAGIAIIAVSLVNANKEPVESICFGKPLLEAEGGITDVPVEAMQLKRASKESFSQGKSKDPTTCPVFVRVSITSTVSATEALHSWVLLTLNQVYIAWCTERHLERMQRKMIRRIPSRSNSTNNEILLPEDAKRKQIDKLCPGLPSFVSLMDKGFNLPHPAFKKTIHDGVIRASTVANVTMDLLEAIASLSTTETRKFVSPPDLFVARILRSETPQRVTFSRSPSTRKNARVKLVHEVQKEEETILRDKPIDCPEYICFYCSTQHGGNGNDDSKNLPMLFKEVVVDDGNSDKSLSIDRLEKLKEAEPHVFSRSFAFVLSVKRNRRTFLAYNWNPHVVKKIVSKMSDMERKYLSHAMNAKEWLQLRALNMLSPPAEGMAGGIMENAGVPFKANSTDSTKTTEAQQLRNATSDTSEALNRAPKPRISRPTSIRRPKLVGQSVEGAAMQAMAASRARASNKQRFGRGGTPGKAGQPQKGQRNDDKRRPGRPKSKDASSPLAPVLKKQSLPADKALVHARRRLQVLLTGSPLSMPRPSLQHWTAMKALIAHWWPTQEKATIPRSVADFLLRNSPRAWSDVRQVPAWPSRSLKSLVLTLAHTIRLWNPGTVFVPVLTKDLGKDNAVLLMSDIKRVRSCRCVAIIKVQISRFGRKERERLILRSQGWLFTLPWRKHAGKDKPRRTTQILSEKDSAGFDKLTADLRVKLNPDSLIFDTLGFLIERVMKSLDNRLTFDEVIPLVKNVIVWYPLDYQEQLPNLNYRAFEVTIVLSSYNNRLINFFDASTHYGWLFAHATERDLIRCGSDALCFRQEIVLQNGIRSTCFMTCDKTDPTKMQLLLICRTQGRFLHEYLFRTGSNSAMTLLNNLAMEAAGLAYEKLRCSAKDLRLNDLWTQFSTYRKRGDDKPTLEDIEELMILVPPRPLLSKLKINDKQKVMTVLGSGIQWFSCCDSMMKEPAFSPTQVFRNAHKGMLYVYYIRDKDVFLLLRLNLQGDLAALDLLSRDDRATIEEKAPLMIQRLTNYLLHYLWYSL